MARLLYKDNFDGEWIFDISNTDVFICKKSLTTELHWWLEIGRTSNKLLRSTNIPEWLSERKEVLTYLQKMIDNKVFV